MSDKYKPFDLERALAGDKFARKHDLKEPDEWHYFQKRPTEHRIFCLFSDNVFAYKENGRLYSMEENKDDLVMLPKIKKLWISIEKKSPTDGIFATSFCYEDREKITDSDKDYHIIQIEITE